MKNIPAKDVQVNNIQSPQNSHYKLWSSLLSAQGLKKQKFFLLSGSKVVQQTLTHHPHFVKEIIYSEKFQKKDHIPNNATLNDPILNDSTYETYLLKHDLFNTLDIFGTHSPLLICHQPEIREFDLDAEPDGLEILCPLGDPQNIGSLIRSCAAFGIKKLILLEESSSPFLPKSLRAASGQIFNVPLFKGPSIAALEKILSEKISRQTFFCLDKNGESIYDFQWPKNFWLLIGEEGQGLPKNLKTKKLSIPVSDKVESLNAAQSAAIAMAFYNSYK